jgi:hypothetical protein
MVNASSVSPALALILRCGRLGNPFCHYATTAAFAAAQAFDKAGDRRIGVEAKMA